jgi:hypothetical protein
MRSFLIGKAGSMLLSPDLIAQWRITQQEYLADRPTVMAHQALDQQRLHIQQEMMQLLVAFLNRSITLKVIFPRFGGVVECGKVSLEKKRS